MNYTLLQERFDTIRKEALEYLAKMYTAHVPQADQYFSLPGREIDESYLCYGVFKNTEGDFIWLVFPETIINIEENFVYIEDTPLKAVLLIIAAMEEAVTPQG